MDKIRKMWGIQEKYGEEDNEKNIEARKEEKENGENE